jgi:predicted amidohydrolase YtcJ
MSVKLLLDGRVHSPARADATAMAVRGDTVLWVGSAPEARSRFAGSGVEVIRLDGAFVAPTFVDAHVHATSTGLLLTGLDLTACRSREECLAAVRRFAAKSDAPVLWGHGWDETRWPQRRPPTRAELDGAVGGRPLYLSRIDVHSALVSSALVSSAVAAPAVRSAGYSADGPLSREAHHVVRRAAQAGIAAAQRRAAQRAFLAFAASRGVGSVHECAGPDISGIDDLRDLLAVRAGPEVVGYWGEPVSSTEQVRKLLAGTGAHGLAGDLFCDGAIGSRTAALHEPYTDAPDTCGVAYLDAARVAGHVVACTEAGVQAGFHVIGDAAVATVVAGFDLAARRMGAAALAARAHRLEHLEMVDAAQATALGRWGVMASVQPQFDAAWGGARGMYAQRLGPERALPMNPLALLARSGVRLAFGSDTPVTPVDPWATVRAAVEHHTPSARVSPEVAFAAHTVGGHRAAGVRGQVGVLVPGAPASYAVWDTDGLTSAVTGASPRCLRTVVHGETIFAADGTVQR